jgi:hypothetical protein
MAEMGQYCKAYLAKDLRQFPGWTENKANVRKEKQEVDGKEVEVDRELDDESILYIQENYVVDEWKSFCHETLQFEIPVYEPIEIPRAEGSEGQPAAPSTPEGQAASPSTPEGQPAAPSGSKPA